MTIYALKDKGQPTGRYVVEVTRGGQRHKRYVDSKKVAQKVEALLKLGEVPDNEGKPQVYGVEDLWNDCRGLWSRQGQKSAGRSEYNFRVACDALKKALGSAPLIEVEASHINKTADILRKLRKPRMGKAQVGGSTVFRYMATLSKALQHAEDHKKITRKPSFTGVYPKDVTPILFHLTEDQEKALRDELLSHTGKRQHGQDLALLMEAQIASGARISELTGLTPDCIQRHTEGNDVWAELEFRDTKNGNSRLAPIPVDLAERLQELVERGMPSYRAIRYHMVQARLAVGLPTTQPTHAHRHTTATRMTQRGEPLPLVQEYLGHASLNTTRRYITVDTRSKRQAMRRLLGLDT